MAINVGFVLVSGEFGGAETMVYEMLERFDNESFDLTLFANSIVVDQFRDVDNLTVCDLGDVPYFSPLSLMGFSNPYAEAKSIVAESCLSNNIELLVYHLPGSLLLTPGHRDILEVFVMHGTHWFDTSQKTERSTMQRTEGRSELQQYLIGLVRRRLIKRRVRSMDRIILTCEYFKDLLTKHGITVQQTVIPNGVDLEIRENRTPIVEPSAPSICYVGGSRNVKGWDILLDAINRLVESGHTLKLFVLRDVREEHTMRRFVTEHALDDYVEFVGYVDRETYLNYLDSCDLFCLPSYSESIPISALEALALGKPVVATDVGGTGEIVTHRENGYLCQTTGESVAKGLSYFLTSPERIEEVGAHNRDKAMRYRWERIVAQYEDCFRQVTD